LRQDLGVWMIGVARKRAGAHRSIARPAAATTAIGYII